jgi:hypothetical protein
VELQQIQKNKKNNTDSIDKHTGENIFLYFTNMFFTILHTVPDQIRNNTVACLLGNVTNNLWDLDLTLDLLDIRQAELQ